MKTREQVLQAIESKQLESRAIDGRDFIRLACFFPEEDLPKFGLQREDATGAWVVQAWTEESVKDQLRKDLAFAFEKALDRRGLSSSSMYFVILMWMWVLEDDELANFENYQYYGLPLYKAVALKYNLPNEIGESTGSEERYSEG